MSRVFKLIVSSGAAGCVVYATAHFKSINFPRSQTTAIAATVTPCPTWDSNWDKRDPVMLIPPSKLNGDVKSQEYKDLIKQHTATAKRRLIFIRHGQYNIQNKDDKLRTLTTLGQEQAVYTGIRLRELGIDFDRFIESSMTRAIETSDLIRQQLKQNDVERTDLLREGSPISPEPPFRHWRSEVSTYTDHPRIEAAFRKFVHRADVTQTKDSNEVIVCHANVIRYIVCRALQIPPEAWLRISLKHGSLTCLTIFPDGHVTLTSLGEAGHIPVDKMSVE
uniref:Serine/threonine-protein phosphatase PGAM5, mitochondrial n=1 Tax=Ciona savignyi TaxID=51511 RepID=H2YDT0_CIOSA